MTATLADRADPRRPRGERFAYVGFEVDGDEVRGTYDLDGRRFTEVVVFPGEGAWNETALDAARLLFLLAGVSYYKAGAAPTIDLGATLVRPGERDLLQSFYVDGLGEFAVRNGLDLGDVELVGGVDAPAFPRPEIAPDPSDRPLIPFGGGLDSIVTVELLKPVVSDPALFVVNRPGLRFEAIETAIAATGLPVVRAERELDAQLLAPSADDRAAWFNGHVPVTGIISAIGLVAAARTGRSALLLSNEWSASSGNVVVDGREVNHQFSKSWAFEQLLAAVAPVPYFSFLRPFSELWIAERFASMSGYHRVFRSCNRAFHLDPARRLDHWCGECDKCAFIDLILAPFLPAAELGAIFGGHEPLRNPAMAGSFRTLLATTDDPKPFECVGDVDECRVALSLIAGRADRAGADDDLVRTLLAEVGPVAPAPHLLAPIGPHAIPDALLAAAHLR